MTSLPARYLMDEGNVWWLEDGELMAAPRNLDGSPAWDDGVEVDFYGIRGEDYEDYILAIHRALLASPPTPAGHE